MSNYHSDKWILDNVNDHYKESLEYFPESRIVGIFYQGSGNYGLDTEGSDVDTKLIVVPTFEEIAFNKKPHSTTHVRANDEHTDFKDLRLMMGCFKKQNLNFVEVLFTKYKWENPLYQEQWDRLVREREAIARYSPWSAVKTMKGIALEKYHALEHEYPSKVDIIRKYGYDGKQLHHLVRVMDFISRYVGGEKYERCLWPQNPEYLKALKQQGALTLDEARWAAKTTLDTVVSIADKFCEETPKTFDKEVEDLLNDVQYKIMEIAVKEEMM